MKLKGANVGKGGKTTLRDTARACIISSMSAADDHYHQAARAAQRAHDLLVQPATLESYDWLLVATLLVEADEAFERAKELNPAAELPLLKQVVEELGDATADFTNREFVAATKAPRRQRPNLFSH